LTSERVPRRTLAFLALGAVAVRLAYLVAFARDYRPQSDANHYQSIASAFANGDGISAPFPFTYQHPTAFRPPLYPALLGAFYWVTGVHVGVGQIVNVALGVVVVLLAAVLGSHIAGARGGLAAGVVVAAYPPILANDVVLLSEPLSLVLLLGMLILLVRDRPAWAGAACGLLVLTRPSAQLLVVVVAAWLVWRAGWRAAVRFVVLTLLVVAPWIVRNWAVVGTPTVVTSNGFNLVSVYSMEAQASGGFANAVFDDRFTRVNLDNRSEVDLDAAYRGYALDAVREDWVIPPRVLGHNLLDSFELRPDKNASAEEDDGRNLTFRYATLPLFYVVTAAGLVGLWRYRRRRGSELLLLQAAYFIVASLATIAVPRLRVPLDIATAIGAGLLVAQFIGRRAGEESPPSVETAEPARTATGWSRRTRILVAVAVVAGVVIAAGGAAFARDRVEDNARTQLERKIARDGPAVQRLAAFDADGLVRGNAPTKAEYKRAATLADRLWLLSPRLAGAERGESRAAARTLDEALFELKVLDLVTGGNRDPATPPTAALDASRVTYETAARSGNNRPLPAWDTIRTNPEMRRAARKIDGLRATLGRP
jgi:4-amino-4-deoxy-L-arabinose transferase-like glycosyltransferase